MGKHTRAPWAWQKVGDGWALMGQHGMRPIVLAAWGVRKSPGPPPSGVFMVRDAERDRMIPFSPSHPDARLIEAAPDTYAALKSVEWSGEAHGRDNCWPCCPSCGSPSPEVGIEPYEATADAAPGVHVPNCVLAAALAKASPEPKRVTA